MPKANNQSKPSWRNKYSTKSTATAPTPQADIAAAQISSADRAVLDNYLQQLLVENGLSENTLSAYSHDLERFLLFTATRSIATSAINEHTMFAYIVDIRKSGLTGRSLARHLSSLRGFFLYARDEGIITEDPTRFLENPKIQKKLPEVLTRTEMQRLLEQPNLQDKVGFRDRTMLELLYASGLRVSELCALKPLDFDAQAGILRIFGKGSKERLVPVHNEASSWLEDYVKHWRPLFNPISDYFFLNRSGKGLSRVAVWKFVQKYALMAGIRREISPHTFRHSFATHLLDGGADLRSVQMLLGHSDISATEIYTHVQTQRVSAVHRKHHPRSTGQN